MPTIVPLNCIEPGLQILTDCPDIKGGISAFAWIGPNALINDFSIGAQWDIDIASGAITITKKIRGLIPRPTAIKAALNQAGGPAEQVTNYTRTFTWKDDFRSPVNSLRYDSFNRTLGRLAIFNTSQKVPHLYVTETAFATFDVGDPVTETDGEFVTYEGIAEWRSLEMPVIHINFPISIFANVLP